MQLRFTSSENPQQEFVLQELYQPIFGHPELNDQAKRNSFDRLESIKKIYSELAKKFERPLRVLDLGCGQGFMTFSLAEQAKKEYGGGGGYCWRRY